MKLGSVKFTWTPCFYNFPSPIRLDFHSAAPCKKDTKFAFVTMVIRVYTKTDKP
jgi:hypothetical protein